MEQTYIEEHFLINLPWKEYFLSKYPKYSTKTWTEDVWKLFKNNGYSYNLDRYSNNPKSKLYNAIKSIALIDPCGKEVICYLNTNINSALEQLLITVICNFDVDFTKFK